MWNDEKFNLDNFSREIGSSKGQLYRKVTAVTGYSPNVFIREYRLTMALKAIENIRAILLNQLMNQGLTIPHIFQNAFIKNSVFFPQNMQTP